MAKVLRVPKGRDHDLFTFVADVAIQRGQTIPIQCNCGGEVPFNPPFEEDALTCAACGASIGLTVLEGDPGYVLAQDEQGNKQLGFVQGGVRQASKPTLQTGTRKHYPVL